MLSAASGLHTCHRRACAPLWSDARWPCRAGMRWRRSGGGASSSTCGGGGTHSAASGRGGGRRHRLRAAAAAPQAGSAAPPNEDMPDPVVLFEGESDLNGTIQIHEVPFADAVPEEIRGSRLLYMGTPARLLGVFRPLGDDYPLTYAYWDYFATLPPLLGEGPVGLFGWGGGTHARLLTEVYDPPPRLLAWELDPRVLDACRLGMGLEELQRAAGGMAVQLGNPLDPSSASVPGGFAGIIVDLFLDGKLLPPLMGVEAWKGVRARLRDPSAGRVMAHLGPAADEGGALVPQTVLALNAMAEAFDGEVHYIDPPEGSQLDVIALTGPLPTRDDWGAAVGPLLAPYTVDWERWERVELEASDVGLGAGGAGEEGEDEGEEEEEEEEGDEEGEEGVFDADAEAVDAPQARRRRQQRGWGEAWGGEAPRQQGAGGERRR
ncbi:MAG: hypothetical protein J3K34DRAFT_526227 [Monoraphidium minutum]|nr:MAG: hypothetical protein J3K34DRAFT_526227 [Monoraphidium minutum]